MPDYKWPDMNQRSLLGKRVSRLDGPDKVSGKAKYTLGSQTPGNVVWKIPAFSLCPRQGGQHRCQRGGEDAGSEGR